MSKATNYGFLGRWTWLVSPVVGAILGLLLFWIVPAGTMTNSDHGHLPVPIWLLVPFGVMLACIALMPFIHARIWEDYYPDIAFVLGGIVAAYVVLSYGADGCHAMGHAALEYFQFIALIGSLYVVSGGVLIQITGHGRPGVNTVLLLCGAVLANIVGTTGASMLLIRPFLRLNKGRLKPFHIAIFIMIVSNCGGCLTPIGDPPLFLGYLKGVPFLWTLEHLLRAWLFVNGALLTLFCILDYSVKTPQDSNTVETKVSIRGISSLLFLILLMMTVIFDSHLKSFALLSTVPAGAILQIVIAILAYRIANKSILEQNGFHWHPVEEVACLFAGIFATMVPALAYLDSHAASLGLSSPTQYYFAAGGLSAVLDNAPTYVSFLQTAFGAGGIELTPQRMPEFLNGTFANPGATGVTGAALLRAISMGAVFFGAMTYIGNGPNFMVKAIAEADGAPTPTFFGYLKYALAMLLPVLIAAWILFVRS